MADNQHRNPLVSLADIDMAAAEIGEIVQGMGATAYFDDRRTQLAVERLLINVGEAAVNLRRVYTKDQTDKLLPEADDIITFRNNLVHQYKSVTSQAVWDYITLYLPKLHEQVKTLINESKNQT